VKAVVARVSGVELVEVDEPELRPGEALVETTVVGVCGSDTHAAAGEHPFVPLPYRPGHEVVGAVRAVAADVTAVGVGDRVTVEPTLPCGNCKMCRTGRSNICENLRFFGCGYEQGGMAERFTVPAGRLHRLPDAMSDLQAALIEPLSTPVHAVRLAGGVRDKTVVVLGAGTIGLLVLRAAQHGGARRTVVTDPLPQKRERALAMGAGAVYDATRPDLVEAVRAELGESADVVFDCVSVQSTVDQAVRLASKGGIVMVVGVPVRPVSVALPELQDLQVRLQGSATYMPEDYDASIEMIMSGWVSPDDFVTGRFPLEEAAAAFAASVSGSHLKVTISPGLAR
jgi:2-desacetyl-2-hydroxyethyl bacteriochlorophyllide A dehydrogenase